MARWLPLPFNLALEIRFQGTRFLKKGKLGAYMKAKIGVFLTSGPRKLTLPLPILDRILFLKQSRVFYTMEYIGIVSINWIDWLKSCT